MITTLFRARWLTSVVAVLFALGLYAGTAQAAPFRQVGSRANVSEITKALHSDRVVLRRTQRQLRLANWYAGQLGSAHTGLTGDSMRQLSGNVKDFRNAIKKAQLYADQAQALINSHNGFDNQSAVTDRAEALKTLAAIAKAGDTSKLIARGAYEKLQVHLDEYANTPGVTIAARPDLP